MKAPATPRLVLFRGLIKSLLDVVISQRKNAVVNKMLYKIMPVFNRSHISTELRNFE